MNQFKNYAQDAEKHSPNQKYCAKCGTKKELFGEISNLSSEQILPELIANKNTTNVNIAIKILAMLGVICVFLPWF